MEGGDWRTLTKASEGVARSSFHPGAWSTRALRRFSLSGWWRFGSFPCVVLGEGEVRWERKVECGAHMGRRMAGMALACLVRAAAALNDNMVSRVRD